MNIQKFDTPSSLFYFYNIHIYQMLNSIILDFSQANSPTMARTKCFPTIDAYCRLIALLVKHSGDNTNSITKINLLNRVSIFTIFILYILIFKLVPLKFELSKIGVFECV